MRAKLITEKFEEESDPISDMGIGGFTPRTSYKEHVGPAIKEWEDSVRETLLGKRIQGKVQMTRPGSDTKSSVIVQRIFFYINGHIEFESTNGVRYRLLPEEKYKITDV